MRVLATHTLLAFALALGALPGGQCVNLFLDHSTQCCQPQASCACCKNLPGSSKQSTPLLAMPVQHCCASIPANELNLPISIAGNTVELNSESPIVTHAQNAPPQFLADDLLASSQDRQRPPDIPLFLKIHSLIV
jgi:hypothetical protein